MITNARILFSFILIFSAFLSVQHKSVAQRTDAACEIRNYCYNPGEKLTYKVFYTLAGAYVGAGEATFETQLKTYSGRQAYHVVGAGSSYPSYDWFYKVRDVYESYIDTLTLLPLKFVRKVQERNTRIFESVLFQHANNKAISTNGAYTIPACVQDVLSSIYYARNLNYEKYAIGDKIEFSMFLDDEVHPVFIRYLGKEILTTRYGKFKTLKFKPLLIEGTIFKGGEDMTVWVTDDANKIPVFIETPILIGKINVYLKNYTQLKHKPLGILRFQQANP
jgi:hypothetical protein